MLEVAAADTELSYGLAGQLYLSHSGWLLLQVPNDIGNGAFAALAEIGVEQPKQSSGNYNAHISVMTADEVQSLGGQDAIKERGQVFHYTTGRVRTVKPLRWRGVSKVWFMECHSPELKQLRKSYGLSPLPNGSHQFHCTFAIRPTRTNFDAADEVGKTAEDDNWNLASCCYRPERHCNCDPAASSVKFAEHLHRLGRVSDTLRKIYQLTGRTEMYFAPNVKLAYGSIWSHLAVPGGVERGGWNKLAGQLGGKTLVSDQPSFDAAYYPLGRNEFPHSESDLYRRLSVACVVGGGSAAVPFNKAAEFDERLWARDGHSYVTSDCSQTARLPEFLRLDLSKFNVRSAIKQASSMSPSDYHLVRTLLWAAECMPGGREGEIGVAQLQALSVGLYKSAEFGSAVCAEICQSLAAGLEQRGELLVSAVKKLLS